MVLEKKTFTYELKADRIIITDENTPYLDLITVYPADKPDKIVLVIKDGNVEKIDLEALKVEKEEEEK